MGGTSKDYFKDVSQAWSKYLKAKDMTERSMQEEDLGNTVEGPSSEPEEAAPATPAMATPPSDLTVPASGGTGDTETPVKGRCAQPLQEHSVVKGSKRGRYVKKCQLTGLSLKKKRRQRQAVSADSQPPKSSEAEEGSAELVLDEKGDDGTKLEVGAGEKGGKSDELNLDEL